MLFNTIEFVFFLPAVIILFYLIPHRFRWIMLLIASYYFYMSWKPEYAILIIVSTLIDYFCAIAMDKHPDKKSKRPFLIISLVSNLGLLFSFKYLNFFSQSANVIFESLSLANHIPVFHLLLPVGISFYTFQTLSYSIDVYNGIQKPEKHLGYFALYVSYFPQLVAGPIERFSRLNPQLRAVQVFNYSNLINGLRLILYGLFIKMVIADNLSVFVDSVYANPENFNSFQILTSLFFYSFQIYSDFYGYSIIAIGSALMMGINIMDNFKTPYLSGTIAEFWQRWHISLSTWFRDYLYLPLGGNKVNKYRLVLNIFIVFVASGFWHGANWTFLIWGALFGLFYLIEKAVFPKNIKTKTFSLKHIVLIIKTFVFVTFTWVFFRSTSLENSLNIFKSIIKNTRVINDSFNVPLSTIILFSIFIISDILLYNKRFDSWISEIITPVRWSIYFILIFSIIVFSGVENSKFIYFQF